MSKIRLVGSTSGYVELTAPAVAGTDSVVLSSANSVVPTGSIVSFAGSAAPSGWLLCDGQAVSRTDYAALFSVVSTTYGSGNGSTTFNIPNLKGRVPVGLDASQTEFDALNETGGAKTNTHNHWQSVGYDGGALYAKTWTLAPRSKVENVAGTSITSAQSTVNRRYESTDNETISTLPPYIVLNYIIKAV